jgi:hypothetical protein
MGIAQPHQGGERSQAFLRGYAALGGIPADLLCGCPCSRDTLKTVAIHAARPASIVAATQETTQLAG